MTKEAATRRSSQTEGGTGGTVQPRSASPCPRIDSAREDHKRNGKDQGTSGKHAQLKTKKEEDIGLQTTVTERIAATTKDMKRTREVIDQLGARVQEW